MKLKIFGISKLYTTFCELLFPVKNKSKIENNFKITEISTSNCLLNNGFTFVAYIFLIFLIILMLMFGIIEIKSMIMRRRNSSKFRTKKRFDNEFKKGFVFEMKESQVPSARSNQLLSKHGVDFVGANIYKRKNTGSSQESVELNQLNNKSDLSLKSNESKQLKSGIQKDR